MKKLICLLSGLVFSMPLKASAGVDLINSVDEYGNTILCTSILNGDMAFAKT
jgi:hypothetical protein